MYINHSPYLCNMIFMFICIEILSIPLYPRYPWNKKLLVSLALYVFECVLLSDESQKGASTIQRCSVENQNGAMPIDFLQQ